MFLFVKKKRRTLFPAVRVQQHLSGPRDLGINLFIQLQDGSTSHPSQIVRATMRFLFDSRMFGFRILPARLLLRYNYSLQMR